VPTKKAAQTRFEKAAKIRGATFSREKNIGGKLGNLETWKVWKLGKFGNLESLETWKVWKLGKFGNL
jgi:ribosomal protein S2